MAMKVCSSFPKLQHHWNLTIQLFSTICWTLIGGLTPLQICSRCILQPLPNRLGKPDYINFQTVTAITQECCEQYWISPGGNTPQSTNYTAICTPITKTIQVRRTRHAGHCWRSRDKLLSDIHLWTPKYGRAKAGQPAWTYIQQLFEDTGCSPEDLPEVLNDREKWRERVRDICASARHNDDDDDDLLEIELFWYWNCLLMINWRPTRGDER